jgi:hypothetical protein
VSLLPSLTGTKPPISNPTPAPPRITPGLVKTPGPPAP